MKTIIAVSCILFTLLPSVAEAERADALKQVNVDYGRIQLDNVKHATIAMGKVIITRGTMVLKSDRAEVIETSDGYRTFILTGTQDTLATFRVKSDSGPDVWSEGHAERIEYDERADTVKLFSRAMIRQLERGRITHQMEQAFISYDSRNEVLLGQNDSSGSNVPSKSRGMLTFEPRRSLTTLPEQATSGKQ